MTNGLQHDFILLDRSGSMEGTPWNEAVSSVNAYVKKLSDDKVDTGVTLAVFDNGPDGKIDFQILRDRIIPSTWKAVTKTEVLPRGGTPLSDAIGRLVALAEAGNYEKVVIVIMTDGYENASRELSVAKARELLERCRQKNWVVIFLGADFVDANAQAMTFGNMAGNTLSVSTQNLGASMSVLASKRSTYATRGVAAATMSYTAAETAELEKTI